MRRRIKFLVFTSLLVMSGLGAVGAMPQQDQRPPQPFFPDFYSGQITVQGVPASAGLQLAACIDNCTTGFESQTVTVEPGGKYSNLVLNPENQALIGRTISFFLLNEYGRIKAAETQSFVGIYDFFTLDLTFKDPLPTPTPTPTPTLIPTATPTASLPVPGDPAVTTIPRMALAVGAGAVVAGFALILVARRRAR